MENIMTSLLFKNAFAIGSILILLVSSIETTYATDFKNKKKSRVINIVPGKTIQKYFQSTAYLQARSARLSYSYNNKTVPAKLAKVQLKQVKRVYRDKSLRKRYKKILRVKIRADKLLKKGSYYLWLLDNNNKPIKVNNKHLRPILVKVTNRKSKIRSSNVNRRINKKRELYSRNRKISQSNAIRQNQYRNRVQGRFKKYTNFGEQISNSSIMFSQSNKILNKVSKQIGGIPKKPWAGELISSLGYSSRTNVNAWRNTPTPSNGSAPSNNNRSYADPNLATGNFNIKSISWDNTSSNGSKKIGTKLTVLDDKGGSYTDIMTHTTDTNGNVTETQTISYSDKNGNKTKESSSTTTKKDKNGNVTKKETTTSTDKNNKVTKKQTTTTTDKNGKVTKKETTTDKNSKDNDSGKGAHGGRTDPATTPNPEGSTDCKNPSCKSFMVFTQKFLNTAKNNRIRTVRYNRRTLMQGGNRYTGNIQALPKTTLRYSRNPRLNPLILRKNSSGKSLPHVSGQYGRKKVKVQDTLINKRLIKKRGGKPMKGNTPPDQGRSPTTR